MTTKADFHYPESICMDTVRTRYLTHTRAWWLLLLVLLLALPAISLAHDNTEHQHASPAVLKLTDETRENIPLKNFLEFYDPGLQNPDIDTIRQLANQQWHKASDMSPALIFSLRHTIWFRMTINNQNQNPEKLVINNGNPLSDSMSVYVCNTVSKLCETKIHDLKNPVTHFIKVNPGSENNVYIEVSGFHSAFPAISLQNQDYFNKNLYSRKLYSGILNGIIIGLTLYILLLAIKTGQPVYYAYCLLGLFNIITIFLHKNLFTSRLEFINGEMKTNLSMVMPAFVTISLVQFIRLFIETAKNHTLIDKILIIYITFTMFIVALFLSGAPMAIILPPFIISSSVVTIVAFYLCVTSKQHLPSSMAMLAIGISMPATSGVLTLAVSLGALSADIAYMDTMQVFDAIEMMMLSLAMLSSLQHLENEHRRQAESALEANIISEAHNRLLAHLNHELRTPLNGILGAAEILVQKSHPRDRHIFSMICHTALPLKHLIDEMVNIRSVTENRKYLQNVRFDLQSLLQECMDVFLPVASSKNIRLFFRVEHDIANDVTGDPNRLRQILLNLIGNACKFTTNGEVGLHVKKQSSLPEKKCLYYFEVTDSGMGISKADEQRLFGIFETANSTINPKGTGLGLSIVRELSELLGGSCGYENNETVGSKFWFSAVLEPHQQVSRKTHKAFEGLSIIIADESQLICEQLTKQISCTAKSVATTNTIEGLQKAIESDSYDVAVIHQTLINEDFINQNLSKNTFLVFYGDNSESLQKSRVPLKNQEESIIRKTSTEAFSLQIVDAIIKRSNIFHKQAEEKITRPPIKILAAEDIPSNQHIIRELIESLNFLPTICSNGKQALDLYIKHQKAESPFTAIIMDCEMPIQDGFETTEKIRNYEKEHQLPPVTIIALTAHTEAAYRRRSEESGMDAYLTKPVTAERILQCLIDAGKT